MDRPLRVGIALYNNEYYHVAHDAWEEPWLSLPEGEDERFLHGLIQYTAAIYHARNRNWIGATGLAQSAHEYLDDLFSLYRGVDLDPVRETLLALETDPEWIERTRPPRLSYQNTVPLPSDLDTEECLLAAPLIASAGEYETAVVERACTYAREALDSRESDPFLALCVEFVRDSEHRAVVSQRLSDRVSRRRAREREVEGLFDPGN
jgi:predicted metal-dependent hydrolase